MNKLLICFVLTNVFISQAVAMYEAPGVYYMYDSPSIYHIKNLISFFESKPRTTLIILERLIRLKKDISIDQNVLETTDDNGNTILHLAALYGRKQELDCALKLEINTELKNKQDQTAIDIIRGKIKQFIQAKDIDMICQYVDCLELIKQNSLEK